MAYFCYVHKKGDAVPHFEVLPEMTARGAHEHATELLAQRKDAIRAEVWEEDTLIFTVTGQAAPQSLSPE
jgi:hypothetical protein